MPPRSRKRNHPPRRTNDRSSERVEAPSDAYDDQQAAEHDIRQTQGTCSQSSASIPQPNKQVASTPASKNAFSSDASAVASAVTATTQSVPHTSEVCSAVDGNEAVSNSYNGAKSRKRKRRVSQSPPETVAKVLNRDTRAPPQTLPKKKTAARSKKAARPKPGNSTVHTANPGPANSISSTYTTTEQAILDTLPFPVQKKVRAMRNFVVHVDSLAGICYTTVDEDGVDDSSRVRMPAREFVAAVKIVAVDFGIQHPNEVGYLQAQDMARFELGTLIEPRILMQWAVVDFTQTCDIERHAQDLLGGLGFAGRSVIGIECCMQTWQRKLRVAAGTPSAGFRPDLDIRQSVIVGFRSWTDAQQQGEREVQAAIMHSKQRLEARASEASQIEPVTIFGMVEAQNQSALTTMVSQSASMLRCSLRAVCPRPPAHVV